MYNLKSSYTRLFVWPGVMAYWLFAERRAKQYNAVDGDFLRRHQFF
jgi:hypothetical protein